MSSFNHSIGPVVLMPHTAGLLLEQVASGNLVAIFCEVSAHLYDQLCELVLLAKDCRMFVVGGSAATAIHDMIDDILIDKGITGKPTAILEANRALAVRETLDLAYGDLCAVAFVAVADTAAQEIELLKQIAGEIEASLTD